MAPGVRTRLLDRLPPWAGAFSGGCWLIALAGLVAGVIALAGGRHRPPGLQMWVFADIHKKLYDPMIGEWNRDGAGRGREPVNLTMLGQPALLRRMLAGFFGGLPTADLIEVERTMAGQLFAGPVEAVGFVDLTDRLREEGLLGEVPTASLSPWTTRGRVFGLPHDVHPVLLGVRMDLVLGAGVSREALASVETWDDLARVLRPVMADRDGDGEPDRYLLSFWPAESHRDKIEMLLLQGGTGFFDSDGMPVIASEANARMLAMMVSWCLGPDRIAADVRDFDATGNQLKADGYAATYFMPDWMCAVWKNELPNMTGTLELMPLPAAEPGGRRTSVWGGTMLGIPKTARDFDAAWAFAKELYFSHDLARELYRSSDIVSPIRSMWGDPVYAEPDAYYRGQAKGLLYIEQIPSVPPRNASPYGQIAILRVADAATRLHRWGEERGVYDREGLLDQARRVLRDAEDAVRRPMERNLFLDTEGDGGLGGER